MTEADTDVGRLTEALAAEPGVVVAYLFGSRARGTSHSQSDIDVAVLFADSVDAHERELDLRATLGDNVDLVVLNDAPVSLAYRVLRDGVLLVSHDDAARIEHWVRTVDRYIDMAPMRRAFDEGLRHRLAEGRFGRS
jgi:predicted nucleotidyltransferase